MQTHQLRLGQFVGPWFFCCLFIFGTLQPGYSHFTKAVSELGAFEAPNALGWNALGFFTTGAMISCFGVGLHRLLARNQVRSTGAWSVIALGITFAATAIPADFELRFESRWTTAHAVFVLLGPIAFVWAAVVWPRALRGLGAPKNSVLALVITGWLIVPAFASNAWLGDTPGIGQRLGLAVMLFWCWVLSRATTKVAISQTRTTNP